MRYNPLDTRLKAVLWIGVWKVLDVISTFALTEVHGWDAEFNLFVRLTAGTVNPELITYASILFGMGVVYASYRSMPWMVESLSIVIPFVVFGNTLQAFNLHLIGSAVNMVVIPVLMLTYYLRDWELFFFDVEFGEVQWRYFPGYHRVKRLKTRATHSTV